MTAIAIQPPLVRSAAVARHRPLLLLALVMAALAVVAVVGLAADPREVLGAPLWAKPLKFAISIAIYAVTLAWLIDLPTRFRRVAWWAGTTAAAGLLVEMVIITGAAAAGTTSHFNVATPLHTVLWSVMATSIVVVWLVTLVIGVLLSFSDPGDRARLWAIRTGVLLALVGMGLAFLMTSPTAAQLQDFRGIAGAHAVGIADGGPGLPLVGWSTVAGDLRVPHFIGMHALQALPIAVLLLELASRRVPLLRSVGVRQALVLVVAVTYLAVLGVLTAQALLGQSVVRPAGPIPVATGLVFAAATVAVALVLMRSARTTRAARS